MSTWVYLYCTDHTPPIRAESESGQHLYDLPQIRTDLAERERITSMDIEDFWELTTDHIIQPFTLNTWRFLREHPNCNIEIRDQYERTYPIKDDR